MNYTTTSTKTVNETVKAIENNVSEFNFGVLHIHDVKETLNNKGVSFSNECKVLDICNPHKAKELLSTDMILSMALPCKISVYTDDNITKISLLKPTAIFPHFNTTLDETAKEIEENLINIINNSK